MMQYSRSTYPVLQEHGKDLSLTLDCPTRWNSLLAMLSRFQQLASCVLKSLIDLKLCNEVTQADYAVVGEIVAALQPVALAVKAICRRDSNLIAAEAAIHFCIVELCKQSSDLANSMAVSLESRIRQRTATHSGVLHYLHNRHESSLLSSVPPASAIWQLGLIQHLLARLDQVHEGKSNANLGASIPCAHLPLVSAPPNGLPWRRAWSGSLERPLQISTGFTSWCPDDQFLEIFWIEQKKKIEERKKPQDKNIMACPIP